MPPTLTLHHGEGQAQYIEHPIQVARRALREAVELDGKAGSRRWQRLLEDTADLLAAAGSDKPRGGLMAPTLTALDGRLDFAPRAAVGFAQHPRNKRGEH